MTTGRQDRDFLEAIISDSLRIWPVKLIWEENHD